jgi:hypothetical protein
MFSPTISAPDMISWDSVSYTSINYSALDELKDDEWHNPDIYSHSVELNLKTDFLTIKANHSIVIKKFEMIGYTGKVLYYIPFTTVSSSPWVLRPEEGRSTYIIPVIRFSN